VKNKMARKFVHKKGGVKGIHRAKTRKSVTRSNRSKHKNV
jgi:hypothetical protein